MSKNNRSNATAMPSCCEAFLYFLFLGFVSVGGPADAVLAGVSAAVVGVIAVVSLELIPEAIVGWPGFGIFLAAFVLIV